MVLGLFAVMTLPLWETLFLGTPSIDGLRICFLAATIAVGILNYLPTRHWFTALVMLIPVAIEIKALWLSDRLVILSEHRLADVWVLMIPWGALIEGMRRREARSPFDEVWLEFRDRWGLVWSQRVREQFNHAAEHAGWPVRLHWQGLVIRGQGAVVTSADREKIEETLRAVLQRFLPKATSIGSA